MPLCRICSVVLSQHTLLTCITELCHIVLQNEAQVSKDLAKACLPAVSTSKRCTQPFGPAVWHLQQFAWTAQASGLVGALQRCLEKLDAAAAQDSSAPAGSSSSSGAKRSVDETAWMRACCSLLQHGAVLARSSDFLSQVIAVCVWSDFGVLCLVDETLVSCQTTVPPTYQVTKSCHECGHQ